MDEISNNGINILVIPIHHKLKEKARVIGDNGKPTHEKWKYYKRKQKWASSKTDYGC